MTGFLFYFATLACLVTLAILAVGVIGFGSKRREGLDGARFSNKLMRWRIIAQFAAVILILVTVLATRG